MLSNLKKSLIERYYISILLELCYFFFYSFQCLAITTVRFHFIWWRHFSLCKEKCHGSRVHHNANPKVYQAASLVPEVACGRPAVGRTAALVPEFAVKVLPLGRTL